MRQRQRASAQALPSVKYIIHADEKPQKKGRLCFGMAWLREDLKPLKQHMKIAGQRQLSFMD
jgi:hypothetical protein